MEILAVNQGEIQEVSPAREWALSLPSVKLPCCFCFVVTRWTHFDRAVIQSLTNHLTTYICNKPDNNNIFRTEPIKKSQKYGFCSTQKHVYMESTFFSKIVIIVSFSKLNQMCFEVQ